MDSLTSLLHNRTRQAFRNFSVLLNPTFYTFLRLFFFSCHTLYSLKHLSLLWHFKVQLSWSLKTKSYWSYELFFFFLTLTIETGNRLSQKRYAKSLGSFLCITTLYMAVTVYILSQTGFLIKSQCKYPTSGLYSTAFFPRYSRESICFYKSYSGCYPVCNSYICNWKKKKCFPASCLPGPF